MTRILTIAFLFISLSSHYGLASAYSDRLEQIEVQLIAQAADTSDSDKTEGGTEEDEPDCS